MNTGTADAYHRLITTNIQEKTVEKCIGQAKVILLLRDQDRKADYQNGILLNTECDKEDHLIIEGKIKPSFLSPALTEKIQFWAPNQEIDNLKEQKIAALEKAKRLLSKLILQRVKTQDSVIKEEKSDEEILATEKLDTHKSNLKKEISKIEECETKIKKLTEETLFTTNSDLANQIYAKTKQYQKVWVIIEERRGRYINSHATVMQGVAYLYLFLQQAKLPYVTLKYLSHKLDELEYSHSPEMTRALKDFERKALEKFIRDMEQKIPSSLSQEKQSKKLLKLLSGDQLYITNSRAIPVLMFSLKKALTWE